MRRLLLMLVVAMVLPCQGRAWIAVLLLDHAAGTSAYDHQVPANEEFFGDNQ